MYGAPGRIRTSDRSVRSRVLYPAELQAHNSAERELSFLRYLTSMNNTKKQQLFDNNAFSLFDRTRIPKKILGFPQYSLEWGKHPIPKNMAESEGFEPSMRL